MKISSLSVVTDFVSTVIGGIAAYILLPHPAVPEYWMISIIVIAVCAVLYVFRKTDCNNDREISLSEITREMMLIFFGQIGATFFASAVALLLLFGMHCLYDIVAPHVHVPTIEYYFHMLYFGK
jgi:O-antigen/teichoic acid export membrane protein